VANSPTARRTSIDGGALVGGRVYFLAFSLAGPDSTPYREVDQRVVLM
jgi:hypothetical protein